MKLTITNFLTLALTIAAYVFALQAPEASSLSFSSTSKELQSYPKETATGPAFHVWTTEERNKYKSGYKNHTEAASNQAPSHDGEGEGRDGEGRHNSILDARSSSTQPPLTKRGAPLSTGALIGVIVGSVALSVLVIIGVIYCNGKS